MGKPVQIVWVFDDAVALEASVAIGSVAAHASPDREYILHLLVHEVNPDSVASIMTLGRRNISIRAHRLPAPSFASPKLRITGQIQFERIALGRHLSGVDRVVYLDTDLVACRDIADLYDVELEGCPIGAVVDLHIGRQIVLGRSRGAYHNLRSYLEKSLSIADDRQESYFNSGVLVLDLEYMRANNIEDRARAILDGDAQFLIPDQCILNMLMLPRAKLLDGRWNVLVPPTRLSLLTKRTAHDAKRRRDLADPFVLHFAGGKPWQHRPRPKASCWWRFAMESPLREEIISRFWAGRGRDVLSTLRSKAAAPLHMAIARKNLRKFATARPRPGTGAS